MLAILTVDRDHGMYSLHQYKGDLRVANTEEPPWLGGLGKGQRIYAVRYLGDKAFVVTFRQVDPLYALDLSDPRAPAVRGALELPGYSAYLHPVTGSRLLGVGRTGGVLQASLFAVSDLGAPRLVSRLDLGTGSSAAELDTLAKVGFTAF